MKFYIKIGYLHGAYKTFFKYFGGQQHVYQLACICVMAENGNSYVAYSRDYNPALVDQWASDFLINHFPDKNKATRSLWRHNHDIAREVLEFVTVNAGKEPIEFYGHKCTIEHSIFRGLYGGPHSAAYPDTFPKDIFDIHQQIAAFVQLLPEEHFRSYPKYSAMPPDGMAIDFDNRMALFYSHFDIEPVGTKHKSWAECKHMRGLHEVFLRFRKEMIETGALIEKDANHENDSDQQPT